MIDLRKFAAVSEKLSHPFGMEGKATAAALHELADRIESGELVAQGAMVLSEADLDDFHFDTFVIRVAPKRPGWISPEAADKAGADLVALADAGALTSAE